MNTARIPISIQEGIALLDHEEPDWWRADRQPAINIEELDIGSRTSDVLGQLYGNYNHGLEKHGVDDWGAANLGLRTFTEQLEEEAELNKAWYEVISARRAAVVQSVAA